MYRNYIKRILDVILSMIALVCLSPIILILWLCLTIANKGASAFFYQERPGKNEKIFKIYKFKSMTDECDKNGFLLPDVQRLTNIGRFIRKTSLDELPQLWNVFKGKMSFVGPRPLLIRYLPYYTPTEKLRHSVRPGITGLAQISGRNNLCWDKKLEYDVEYASNVSFILDSKIIYKTKMQLHLYILYIENEIASFMSGLICRTGKYIVPRLSINNKYTFFSLGILLINEVIKYFSNNNQKVNAIDLSEGEEEYKYKMGGVTHYSYNFILKDDV